MTAETPLPPEPEVAELTLAADFPAATEAQWRALAAAVLRRADPDVTDEGVPDKLATHTADGLTLAPIYPRGADAGLPGRPPFTRGATVTPGWDVRQRHADPDPAATREAVLADLENGVTSLWLVLGPAGVPVDGLDTALDGVYLDLAAVALDAGDETSRAADAYLTLLAERGVAPADARGSLGADPLGWTARVGAPPNYATLRDLGVRCTRDWPGLRAATVDATGYHEAGGSDAQELGYALATGVAYLRELTGAGLTVPEALGQLEFRYAVSDDQFGGIAKLRAARRLWFRVADACGAPESGAQRQHAVTSWAMMTARDPWVNMLRTTVACVAAGVGGAGSVTVLPFDTCLGLPDAFARRIARNTQTVLLEEAHVGRVLDPAGGSGYVEARTEALAHAAWEVFTGVERAGGLARVLADGSVAEALAQSRATRAADVAHRRAPITGVSEYPQLDEVALSRRPAPPAPTGGLPRYRWAEPFEALRDRADALSERPTVFLATLGPVAAHTARAGFAANLFAAGGIATVSAGPVTDPAQMAALFAASGAHLACLCGSDTAYGELAEAMARALAPASRAVWLAGRPASIPGLAKGGVPGVDRYVHAGTDAVAALTAALDLLEQS